MLLTWLHFKRWVGLFVCYLVHSEIIKTFLIQRISSFLKMGHVILEINIPNTSQLDLSNSFLSCQIHTRNKVRGDKCLWQWVTSLKWVPILSPYVLLFSHINTWLQSSYSPSWYLIMLSKCSLLHHYIHYFLL